MISGLEKKFNFLLTEIKTKCMYFVGSGGERGGGEGGDILIYFHQNRFHLIAAKMFLGAKYRAENIGKSHKKWHKKVRSCHVEPMSHLYVCRGFLLTLLNITLYRYGLYCMKFHSIN